MPEVKKRSKINSEKWNMANYGYFGKTKFGQKNKNYTKLSVVQ